MHTLHSFCTIPRALMCVQAIPPAESVAAGNGFVAIGEFDHAGIHGATHYHAAALAFASHAIPEVDVGQLASDYLSLVHVVLDTRQLDPSCLRIFDALIGGWNCPS